MKTKYCLGFAFDYQLVEPRVLLITKKRPDWQAGRLNGIGGKVERRETPIAAMAREAFEEAGAPNDPGLWTPTTVMEFPKDIVHVFAANWPSDVPAVSKTDEPVRWYPASHLEAFPVIPNLHWLVPMALLRLKETLNIPARIIYGK